MSDIDAKNLASWGFNVVRLGVMWVGLEPGAKGSYNATYLDEIETIVKTLSAENIYVILDFHQDLLHRKYCGEGVPDYVYETCVAAEPKGTKAFPLPVANQTFPVDSEGNPELDSCLERNFAAYYLSAEVGAAFQCLYDNVDGLWDAFAGYWTTVAQRFKDYDSVLGYELINEPWAGNVYRHPTNLLPGRAEALYLQPMYEYLNTAIRAVDDEKIIFFEGLTIDYFPSGFTAGPGGESYNSKQALAYHIYCPLADPTVGKELACNALGDEFFLMRKNDVERIGGGMIMTEFGASKDVLGDIYQLEKYCHQADKHGQSWMYWQFKYYGDITTCTPVGESLYDENGEVVEHKLKVLSRTYPQYIAGSTPEYFFNPVDGVFKLSYTPLASIPSSLKLRSAAVTQIYYNRELYYPHGAKISITSSDGSEPSVEVNCGTLTGLATLRQTASVASSDVSYSVTISPCSVFNMDTCTCKL